MNDSSTSSRERKRLNVVLLQVLALVKQRPGLKRISFVAHSLGGLIARYAIGKLYGPTPDGEALTGRIAGLEPINFITVATPHLGSRGHKQV